MTLTTTHPDAERRIAHLLFQDFERRYRHQLGDRWFAELVRDAVQAGLLPPFVMDWVWRDENAESDSEWGTDGGENDEHPREPEPDEDGVLPAPRLILRSN